jgi:hypothetical protein
MKATILINRQEERERERERERETRRRENGRERIEADDARAAVCPGGYQYQKLYPGNVQLASAREYPSVLVTTPFQPVLSRYPDCRVITGGSGSGSCNPDPSSKTRFGGS